MPCPKTLLVGLDAACWEYLDPLLEAGRLPTIQKLMSDGAAGVLHSTMPPWTPTAWSSLITGKNPGKHGIFDLLWRTPGHYTFQPTGAHLRQGVPFWQHLNDAGVRVGLVNIPFTYPPAPINGFMLCGFGTPDDVRDLSWPPEALQWIENRLGMYEPVVSTTLLRSGRAQTILAAEKEHQARLISATSALLERCPVDVLAINLMLTDHANHKMPSMALVEEAYVQADADIAALLQAFQPDNVLLISDHGSSRLKGDFLLNVWLREHDYCVYQPHSPQQQSAALSWTLKQWTQDYKGWSGRPEKALRHLLRAAVPRLPRTLQRRFWTSLERAIPFAETDIKRSTRPDFTRTSLFPGSLYSGLLYFNVAGREPNGVLPPTEKRSLVHKLKTELLQIREPDTGQPLFANVYSVEELYDGPVAVHAPDIILDAYRSNWNIRTRQPAALTGKQHSRYFVTFDQKRDYGWHSPDGLFIFVGPAISRGCAGDSKRQEPAPHLMDVPATLLHIYDVPIPDDWDGRVLTELLTPELGRRPVRTQPAAESSATAGDGVVDDGYSIDQADAMLDHLRALGYLD